MQIKDEHIREALKVRLRKYSNEVSIIEELSVFRGLAIADVVALFQVPHCFEIKSDVDSLRRLESQAQLFSQTFPKITLVAASKHISKAMHELPSFWGLIEAKGTASNIVLKNIRRSGYNPQYRKENLLGIIWNSDLRTACEERSIKNYKDLDRRSLSNVLAQEMSKEETYSVFNCFLKKKLQRR